MIKALIACEYSGIVRDAFTKHGADAMSCDLIPTMSPGKHITGDVLEVLRNDSFDIVVAFPPCTYLCLTQMQRYKTEPDRFQKTLESIEFIDAIWTTESRYVAIENPTGIIPRLWRKYDDLVYPYNFGDPYRKDICFWLKGLPPLISTSYSVKRGHMRNHTNSRMTQEQKSKIHSRFYPKLADAMAAQWMSFIKSKN